MTRDWRHYDTAASHFIPSTSDDELKIHIRSHATDPDRPPVLFVHGATFASRMYDIPHPGASWLKACDAAGFAAYAMDVRGYGRSRSPALHRADAPYARAAEAVMDIDDVVNWLRVRHDVDRLHVVGGSWGTVTSSLYAGGTGAAKIAGLVLFAPIYAERNDAWIDFMADPDDRSRFNPATGPARPISEEDTRRRWDEEIVAGDADAWREEGVLRALFLSTLDDDIRSGDDADSVFHAPNGTLVDLWSCFTGTPMYDPARIACPCLLMRGSADTTSTRSDALRLFDRLATRDKRYIEIAHGSHFATAERVASQLFAEAHAFLGMVEIG